MDRQEKLPRDKVEDLVLERVQINRKALLNPPSRQDRPAPLLCKVEHHLGVYIVELDPTCTAQHVQRRVSSSQVGKKIDQAWFVFGERVFEELQQVGDDISRALPYA